MLLEPMKTVMAFDEVLNLRGKFVAYQGMKPLLFSPFNRGVRNFCQNQNREEKGSGVDFLTE